MAHMLIVTAVVVLVYGLAAAAVLAVYRAADVAASNRERRPWPSRAGDADRRADQQPRLPGRRAARAAEAAAARRGSSPAPVTPAVTYQRTMAPTPRRTP